MNLVQSILNFLNTNEDSKPEAPEALCPNCWGRQEYGQKFYESIKQENLNIYSMESNVGWVSAYANKHLQGIALQRTGNGEELVCGACKASFQGKK